jgi:hypothetical protein
MQNGSAKAQRLDLYASCISYVPAPLHQTTLLQRVREACMPLPVAAVSAAVLVVVTLKGKNFPAGLIFIGIIGINRVI